MSPDLKAKGSSDESKKSAEIEKLSPKRLAALNALNDGVPLLILGMALLFAGRIFSIVDNEALALISAAQPVTTILSQFRHAVSLHDSPPLYDLLLHVWLLLSAGALALLRVPSALFFLAGVWTLSRAARFWGGTLVSNGLLWLCALWPYGVHYGIQATWYSFSFLLIAALIWAYLRFCESPGNEAWTVVCALGLLLIYVSYFGWAILVLLGVDNWLRNREQQRPAGSRLVGTAAILAIAYAPLWPAFFRGLRADVNLHPSARALLLSAAYNVYVLLASESVAPWFWRFGVPVAIAVAAALLLSFFVLRTEVHRFLVFGVLLLVGMDLLGVLQADRLLLLAPWFLLPIAVALCTAENKYLRRALAVALLMVSGIGWYGVYVRRYYATARFAEPWSDLAAGTAGAVQQGAGVVSNSPAFFLYLTGDLGPHVSGVTSRFTGFLPDAVINPQIWSADDWKEAGRPIRPYMIWIGGLASSGSQSMEEASDSLDRQCGGRVDRLLVHDPAYEWKQRLFPTLSAAPWRIEIRQYLCSEGAPVPTAPPVSPATPTR